MDVYKIWMLVIAHCVIGVACGVYWETKRNDIKLDAFGVVTLCSMAALGPLAYIFGWIMYGKPLSSKIILFKKKTGVEK
jgi:cytochrome bd-type quinol oxidase subunit 1